MHQLELNWIREQEFKIQTYKTNNEVLDFINEINMDKKLAIQLIENWNGEDFRFTMDGDIYTEDDVQEAYEFLEEKGIEL